MKWDYKRTEEILRVKKKDWEIRPKEKKEKGREEIIKVEMRRDKRLRHETKWEEKRQYKIRTEGKMA